MRAFGAVGAALTLHLFAAPGRADSCVHVNVHMDLVDAADRARLKEIQTSGKKVEGFREGIQKEMIEIQYPRAAEKRNLEGLVTAKIGVDRKGKVISVEAISGEEPFLKPTMAAAKSLRFWSPKLDGVEKDMVVDLTVRFVRQACR